MLKNCGSLIWHNLCYIYIYNLLRKFDFFYLLPAFLVIVNFCLQFIFVNTSATVLKVLYTCFPHFFSFFWLSRISSFFFSLLIVSLFPNLLKTCSNSFSFLIKIFVMKRYHFLLHLSFYPSCFPISLLKRF